MKVKMESEKGKVKNDIRNEEDIKLMVDTFYEKVREDELLGSIFNNVIGDYWDVHLEKMYRFWRTLALKEYVYHGNPFDAHTKLPVKKEHFERWVSIFTSTVSELFEGETADEAKKRATFMAEMFRVKMEYMRKEEGKVENGE